MKTVILIRHAKPSRTQLEFNLDSWSEIGQGSAILASLVFPKKLRGKVGDEK